VGVVWFEDGPWSGRGHLLGAFYSLHSERSPIRGQGGYDPERFFRGAGAPHRAAAELALQYLSLHDEGQAAPWVTAAFWDEGERLAAADPWDVVREDGGANLLDTELIEDEEAAFAAWQENYQMSPAQVGFARSLCARKLARPEAAIELTPADVAWLASTFEDPRARHTELARLMNQAASPEETEKQVADALKWLDSLDPAAEAQKALRYCLDLLAAVGIVAPDTPHG
jgi:hypothetical protein